MSDVFRKGKVYKFSLEKYKRYTKDLGDNVDSWARQCDQKIVNVLDADEGKIDGYRINPNWCVEV